VLTKHLYNTNYLYERNTSIDKNSATLIQLTASGLSFVVFPIWLFIGCNVWVCAL